VRSRDNATPLTEASSMVSEAEASDLSSQRAVNTEASTTETVHTLAKQPTSRLYSTDESVVTGPPLPATDHPFLPWALFLSKVLQFPALAPGMPAKRRRRPAEAGRAPVCSDRQASNYIRDDPSSDSPRRLRRSAVSG
jgi:hypothetical protein